MSRKKHSLKNSLIFSYYLFAVGSRSNGNLRLGVQARMYTTTLTAGTSSLVANAIQRISVTPTVVAEQQVRCKGWLMIAIFDFEYLAIYLQYQFSEWHIGSSINNGR